MRSKEQAHDYRYFPEPDLLPLWSMKNGRKKSAPACPSFPKRAAQRMMKDYGITERDAHTLTLTRAMADQFESAARTAKNPKRVANLVQSELMGRLKAKGLELEQSPISMAGSYGLSRSGRKRRNLGQDAERSLRSLLRAQQGLPCCLRRRRAVPSSRATHRRWKNRR
jgi:Asp-tRNA(Asn)/Glu-tRNA(Gln) amidotransferase B subunit